MKKKVLLFILITLGYFGSAAGLLWILGKIYTILTDPIIEQLGKEELEG